MDHFVFVDLFCGGGGSTSGAVKALRDAGVAFKGYCFDQWGTAIETIKANYPELSAHCTPVEKIDPVELAKQTGHVDVLWASPSCTHHSNMAGGVKRKTSLRNQPDMIPAFLKTLSPTFLIIENVPQLKNWGPVLRVDTWINGRLYKKGSPDPRLIGTFFRRFIRSIELCGYAVSENIINSADFGLATRRFRLFLVAVKKSSGKRFFWPNPTHAEQQTLFISKTWTPVCKHINWSERLSDTNLCDQTKRRIKYSQEKYGEIFILTERGTQERHILNSAKSIWEPITTVTCKSNHMLIIGKHHRMLTNSELSEITGFPRGYKFFGKKQMITKQIGNAVCPPVAESLYKSILSALN